MYIFKYFNPNDYLTLFLLKTGLETERLLINFPFVWRQATIYKANRQITSEGTLKAKWCASPTNTPGPFKMKA